MAADNKQLPSLRFAEQVGILAQDTHTKFHLTRIPELNVFVLVSQVLEDRSQKVSPEFDAAKIASDIIVQVIKKHGKPGAGTTLPLASSILSAAIKRASNEVYHSKEISKTESKDSLQNVTVGADIVWMIGDHLVLGHVGVGRIYLFRKDALDQLTTDHTYAQNMFSENLLSEQEAKGRVYASKVKESLGGERDPEIEILRPELQDGDRILICSRGAYRSIADQDLRNLLEKVSSTQSTLEQTLRTIKDSCSNNQRSVAAFLIHYSFKPTTPRSLSAGLKMDAVKSNSLFSMLGFVERSRLLEIAKSKSFGDKVVLAKEGEVPEQMWIILSGKVKIYRNETEVAEREFGAVIGESILIAQELRTAKIVTSGPVQVLEFQKESLLQLMEGYMNNTAARIYRSIAVFQHYRLVELTKEYAELSSKTHSKK